MHADIQGALNQINKSYSAFEHRGNSMSKAQVKVVLEYGLKKGYKTTDQFTDEEVDQVLGLFKEKKATTINENNQLTLKY